MDNQDHIFQEILKPDTPGYKQLTNRYMDKLLEIDSEMKIEDYDAMMNEPDALVVVVDMIKCLINLIRLELEENKKNKRYSLIKKIPKPEESAKYQEMLDIAVIKCKLYRRRVKQYGSAYQAPGTSQQAFLPYTTLDTGDVAIGNNCSKVPIEVFDKAINASKYTISVRILLESLFGKEVLSNSSLSGKPNPAFTCKRSKQPLNKLIVDDIIQIVMHFYPNNNSVTPSSIRTIMTTKCADEGKLAKKRRKNNTEDSP